MSYSIALERGELNYEELEPLYRQHYAEMRKRLAADGFEMGEYAPRLDRYFPAFEAGWLLNHVARTEAGKAVGYANIYLTNDMHNGDLIANEDTIYVDPDHRNGLGRRLAKAVLDDLQSRGVKRLSVQSLTDLRADVLWRRMGFREVAKTMIYEFEERLNVRS